MSAYCELKTVYKDEKILIESLQALGFTEVENHLGKKSALVGYAHEPTVYADLVVRKAHAKGFSKDFGFSRQPDGTFIANINDMDEHKFSKIKGELATTYATKAAQNKAKKLGLRVAAAPKRIGNKIILEYVQL